MSTLNGIKQYGTAIYPVHAAATSGLLKRAEPILTPEQLVSRFLKGIPLTFMNGDQFTTQELTDRIVLATNQAEALIQRPIITEIFKQKVPFDYSLYRSYIHIRAEHGPITTLEYLAIISADGNNIFQIPPTWIEAANFSKNLINVVPLLAAYGVNTVSGAVGNAGIAFLTVIDGLNWVPAYWEIGYTAGLSNTEGQVPIIVNELIGCIAAIDILSEIAPNFIYNSQALSQDGISQSSSGPGPKIYQLRIEELEKKRDKLVNKIRGIFSSKYFIDNI
jgi:hypothetical protein